MLKKFKFIFFVALAQLTFSHSIYADIITNGNSAFLYGKNQNWIKQIKMYNSQVSFEKRFNYLFPLAGKVHIKDNQEVLQISYDPSITEFYKKQMPNVKVLANISYWVAHSNFKNWSQKNYLRAANQIANIINNDPNVSGVHLDIEVYTENMLPFYSELSRRLEKAGKIIALFASDKDISSTLLKALGKNGLVILYGYDLHEREDGKLPVSPETYQQRLAISIQSTLEKYKNSSAYLMVGVPAVATAREWEEKKACFDNHCSIIKSGFKQDAYFLKALELVQSIRSNKYLGYVVWAFVDNKKGQSFFPLDISKSEWKMMVDNQKIE